MFRASAVSFWRIDFALGIHKTTDEIGILEIDFLNSILAKVTEFFLHHANFVAVAIIVHIKFMTCASSHFGKGGLRGIRKTIDKW